MPRRIDRKVLRGIIHKQCSCCRRYRPESEFNKDADAPDRLQRYCKKCNMEYCKEWSKGLKGR